jgi:hypothetical protein
VLNSKAIKNPELSRQQQILQSGGYRRQDTGYSGKAYRTLHTAFLLGFFDPENGSDIFLPNVD